MRGEDFVAGDKFWKLRWGADEVGVTGEAGEPGVIRSGVGDFFIVLDVMGEGAVAGFAGDAIVRAIGEVFEGHFVDFVFVFVAGLAGGVAAVFHGFGGGFGEVAFAERAFGVPSFGDHGGAHGDEGGAADEEEGDEADEVGAW